MFDAIFSAPGEANRLDYAIREHEALKARVATLMQLLVDKQVITRAELAHLDLLEMLEEARTPEP